MKRSNLPRRTPLKRVARKVKRPTSAREVLAQYASEHERCAVCGIHYRRVYDATRRLTLHHICGRGKRHNVEGNLICLCARDHAHLHDGGHFGDDGDRLPPLTHGHIVWAKAESDGVDLELLASLKNWKSLPEDWMPCELPAAFLRERIENWRI